MSESQKTEQRILKAAEEVFHEKGYDGARMREIADQAGINKGLLHYYFKTKDKLFEAIFGMALKALLSKIRTILELETTLEEKMNLIVDHYMALVMRNPDLPKFVIGELNKNPDAFIARNVNDRIKQTFADLQKSIQNEVDLGRIKPIDARQLLMNLISMIIFPFIGRPMMQVLFAVDNNEFKNLMVERREHIKNFIKQALRP